MLGRCGSEHELKYDLPFCGSVDFLQDKLNQTNSSILHPLLLVGPRQTREKDGDYAYAVSEMTQCATVRL